MVFMLAGVRFCPIRVRLKVVQHCHLVSVAALVDLVGTRTLTGKSKIITQALALALEPMCNCCTTPNTIRITLTYA